MLHNLDIGHQVMPDNAAAGWLITLLVPVLLVALGLIALRRMRPQTPDQPDWPAELAADEGADAAVDAAVGAAVGSTAATPVPAVPAVPDHVEDPVPAPAIASVVTMDDVPAPVVPVVPVVPAAPAVPVAGTDTPADGLPARISREVKLARNTMNLLVRQLGFLEQLRSASTDEAHVAELARLEQLAQQMRRNCSSVLVVAGMDPTQIRHKAMPTSELLQQALSQIEQAHRVALSVVADPIVPAHLSAPLTLLMAEIIDNATRFSEPTSTVMLLVSHTEEGLRIRVADDGAGIGPEKLAELNQLIMDPRKGADLSTTRGLGLAAVSRLAQRIGAEVSLSSNIGRGTVTSLDLPIAHDTGMVDVIPGSDDISPAEDEVPSWLDDARAPAPVAAAPVAAAPVAAVLAAPLAPPVFLTPAPTPEAGPAPALAPMIPVQQMPHQLAQPVPQLAPQPVPQLAPPLAQQMPQQLAQQLVPQLVAAPIVPAQPAPVEWAAQAGIQPMQLAQPVPAVAEAFVPEVVEDLSGISWLAEGDGAEAELLAAPASSVPALSAPVPPAPVPPAPAAQPQPVDYLAPAPTHAAAEPMTRPPTPWELDGSVPAAQPVPPSTHPAPLAVDVLPRRKGLMSKARKPRPADD